MAFHASIHRHSCIFHSCNFQPCDLLLHFPLPHFQRPPCGFQLLVVTTAVQCVIIMACISHTYKNWKLLNTSFNDEYWVLSVRAKSPKQWDHGATKLKKFDIIVKERSDVKRLGLEDDRLRQVVLWETNSTKANKTENWINTTRQDMKPLLWSGK